MKQKEMAKSLEKKTCNRTNADFNLLDADDTDDADF